MKKLHVAYELTNGDTGNIRIIAADKIRFESYARTHGMPIEDGPTSTALMLYNALKRTNVTSCPDFDEFISSDLIDYHASVEEPEDEAANPTR